MQPLPCCKIVLYLKLRRPCVFRVRHLINGLRSSNLSLRMMGCSFGWPRQFHEFLNLPCDAELLFNVVDGVMGFAEHVKKIWVYTSGNESLIKSLPIRQLP